MHELDWSVREILERLRCPNCQANHDDGFFELDMSSVMVPPGKLKIGVGRSSYVEGQYAEPYGRQNYNSGGGEPTMMVMDMCLPADLKVKCGCCGHEFILEDAFLQYPNNTQWFTATFEGQNVNSSLGQGWVKSCWIRVQSERVTYDSSEYDLRTGCSLTATFMLETPRFGL